MEDSYLYIISAIISLVIIREVLQLNASDRPRKLKLLDIASYTIGGLLIMTMLYTQNDLSLMIMLGIVCVPFAVFISIHFYREDRKRFLYSTGLMIAFIIVTWVLYFF